MAFNNETFLGHNLGLTHAPDRPQTVEELADWLENISALDEAEAWRFLKPELMREQYLEEAEQASDTVLHDVKRGYYEVDEAYQRYLLKQTGVTSFGVVETPNGERTVNVGRSALLLTSA